MKTKIIDKENLPELLSSIGKNYRVYGPVKGKDGVELSEVRSDEEIVLDFTNFKLSPKSSFFPQCEVIGISDGDILSDVSLSDEKNVIFGIKPCDARAISRILII